MSQHDPMSHEIKVTLVDKLARELNIAFNTARMFLENNSYVYERAKAEATAAKK